MIYFLHNISKGSTNGAHIVMKEYNPKLGGIKWIPRQSHLWSPSLGQTIQG